MENLLIISLDSYSWIKYCSGLIMNSDDSDSFSVMIINKDDKRPISNSKFLCEEAIYAQRVYDIRNIGRKLGVKKISNLLQNEDRIDIYKVTTQIQLNVIIGNVKKIYFQHCYFLNNVMKSVKKIANIDVYSYGKKLSGDEAVILNNEDIKRKEEIINSITGYYNGNIANICVEFFTEVV